LPLTTTTGAALKKALRSTLGPLRHWVRRFPALRRMLMPVLRPFITPLIDRLVLGYGDWVRQEAALVTAERTAIAWHVAALGNSPVISVVMPVYETPEPLLRAAIASVEAQFWPHWQLCIADDASPSPHVARVLAEAAARDRRIKTVRRPVNGHICAASNSAMALATGEWIALMDHDDVLPEMALYELAAAIHAHPEVEVIYSDEDNIDGAGIRSGPYFKPDFDPELLLAQNLVSHLGAYRHDLITALGGFREGFEGSQDHDLVLRATRHCGGEKVRHIPTVLYHWRQFTGVASFSESAIERCIATSTRAVTEHLAAIGVKDAEVTRAPLVPMFNRIVYPLPATPPLVSIIIAARDGSPHLAEAVDGILQGTDYPAMELLVAVSDAATLPEHGVAPARLRIVQSSGKFSPSRLCNDAVALAQADVLVLLADDLVPETEGWLGALVSQAIRKEVGAVGGKLLHAGGTIAHAGYVLGVGSPEVVCGSFCAGLRANDPGPSGRLAVTRSVSAVSAEALALRRDLFEAMGGFDAANLVVSLHDIDLCLRLRASGLRNICTPDAVLRHLRRTAETETADVAAVQRLGIERNWLRNRWGVMLDSDPYWNPNLSLERADGEIAPRSRRTPPWHGSGRPAA
jgi:GT2 family glycosyltransferase